jgi:transglutaminase-like putative cysteine protease
MGAMVSNPWRAVLRAAVPAGVLLASLSVARADIVLHEYFRPDPTDDLELQATTGDGAMSAAIQTQAGAVGAPDPEPGRLSGGSVYGGEPDGTERGGSFRIDADTTQPPVVRYEDPFTPEIMPFKRSHAFDAVLETFELSVHDPSLVRVEVEPGMNPDDDPFYADFDVELVSGTVVRIPTVGPNTRALALRTAPPTPVEILRDGADNWFLRSSRTGRVRVTMQLAIDRATFGSTFAAVAWSRLARSVPAVPGEAREAGRRVAETIGVTATMSPRAVLEVLVAHFRGFAPSAEVPVASPGAALFESLALSQKGVCRHRAFAFVVTALAIGLPARFVHNEAHAWVEVYDTVRWHRIDLGGAAGRVDSDVGGRPAHVLPRDPYLWPPGSDSGAAMADHARQDGTTPQAGAGAGAWVPGGDPEPPEAVADDRPRSEVRLVAGAASTLRGERLAVSGAVAADGKPCALVRVDVELRPHAASGHIHRVPLGTLVTDSEGRYEGRVVVPYGVPVGDYAVVAVTPGGLTCGRGESP